jgi:hypothetical protein
VSDNHGASSTATASITVIGQNDAPVIQTGGGGDEATYWIRVNNSAITTVQATDVDNGDVVASSIVGGLTRAASPSIVTLVYPASRMTDCFRRTAGLHAGQKEN